MVGTLVSLVHEHVDILWISLGLVVTIMYTEVLGIHGTV